MRMFRPRSPERLPKVQDNKQYVLDDPVQEQNSESDPHIGIPESHPPDVRNMKYLQKMTSFIYHPIQTGYAFKSTFAGACAFKKSPVDKPSCGKKYSCSKSHIEQSSVTDRFKKPFP